MKPTIFVLIAAATLIHCKGKSSSAQSTAGTPAATDPTVQGPAVAAVTATKFALTGATNVGAEGCGVFTLETQDTDSAVATLASDEVVNLTSSATTGKFYSDSACATAITNLTIASGTSAKAFYYKDTAVASVTLGFSDAGTLGLSQLTAQVTVSAITDLVFTGTALSQTTAACGSFMIETQAGTASSPATSALTINLSSSTSTGAFYSDAACTTAITSIAIASGAADSAVIYYKDGAAGSPTLTAAESPSMNWVKATMSATITQ